MSPDRSAAINMAKFFSVPYLKVPTNGLSAPVAEVTYDHTFSETEEFGLLAGAIWQASNKLAFDIGIKQARINSKPETEIRAGLDFSFSVL
jgi:hypothetical protein